MRRTISCPRRTPDLIGSSAAFLHAYDLIGRAASTNVSVLLLGETGVGKERFARYPARDERAQGRGLRRGQLRRLPDELIESELFGVEKRRLHRRQPRAPGKFERADGGTLFLDEVGELPLAAQAKLLRALQEARSSASATSAPRKVNVRLVAATNVDLQAGQGGHGSARPVLPPQRLPGHHPAAARAHRRHPAAGRGHGAPLRNPARQAHRRPQRQGDARTQAAHLAGQRPRARERARARRDPRARTAPACSPSTRSSRCCWRPPWPRRKAIFPARRACSASPARSSPTG
jgi:hypothetical protein